jgi:tetratricopeptide (TPR) repeat protein/tRNA A-37 threonylcarbamoyl transferase component Bud32
MIEPSDRAEQFLRRIQSEWAEERNRQLIDAAVARQLLTPDQAQELLRAGSANVADELLRRGWISRSQSSELCAELDRRALDPPPLAGLARYQLLDRIGEGAVSVVHRAKDRVLDRLVAVKLLKESLLLEESVRNRFLKEAQILARMDHPNIVRVYDSGEDGGRLYLVMELVDGAPLRRRLEEGRGDLATTLGLIEQVARGVHHAHEHGIIHRDLKPDNILVPKCGQAKVADFGLAHLIAESNPAVTRSGAILGTPMYMAPEQVKGKVHEITERTDVYALGAILYHFLSGRPPVEGTSVADVYEKILRDDPPPLDRSDRELDLIARKALDKEPVRRYLSAHEFAEDLRRYLAKEPVLARPLPPLVALWRKAKNHRTLLIPSAVGLLFLVVLAAGWFQQRQRTVRQSRAARLLETARPLLEKASRAQYDQEAPADAVLQPAAEAQSLIEEALAAAPDSPLANYRLGEAWSLRGFTDRAETCWRKTTELDPRFGPAHFQLGKMILRRAYFASLNFWLDPKVKLQEEARAIFSEGIREFRTAQEEGSGFDNRMQREIAAGMMAYLEGRKNDVETICGRALQSFGRQEGTEEFYWLMGLIGESERLKIEAFDKALAIRPKFAVALYGRGFSHWHVQELDPSIQDFSGALLLNPDLTEVYIYRGTVYIAKSDLKAAVDDFTAAIGTDRVAAAAYNGRGVARMKKGDTDGAIADFDQAIRLKPDNFHLPYAYRAEARLKRGDYDGAIADCTKTLSMVHWTYLYKVEAQAYLAKGDRSQALAALAKGQNPGTSAPALEAMLRELERQTPGR